ncbi:hypothetical protein BURKHO8Y_180194 [Burkholderia sp. 8Y]|nr:hypothetical protein BURKHO8Y_180194 [Burkholderia sp. 8Y]
MKARTARRRVLSAMLNFQSRLSWRMSNMREAVFACGVR